MEALSKWCWHILEPILGCLCWAATKSVKGTKGKGDDMHNYHAVPMDTLLKYSCLFVNYISPPKAQNDMMWWLIHHYYAYAFYEDKTLMLWAAAV